MKYSAVLLGSMALSAHAFPAVMQMANAGMQSRGLQGRAADLHRRAEEEKRQLPDPTAAQALSKARKNCGVVDCLVFDATAQYVSTTGEHAYASPAADEIRVSRSILEGL